jgi:hypothetical protein
LGAVLMTFAPGRTRRHSFTLALGEAGEACSAIGMARLDGAKAQQDKLRRVGLMLRAMIR